MHQHRSIRPTIRRFVLPIGMASILAWGFVLVTTVANTCYPLCVIWNDSNPEWYLFLCFLC